MLNLGKSATGLLQLLIKYLFFILNTTKTMKKDRFGKARTLYPDELDTLVASFPYSTPKILAATLRFSGGRCSEIAQSQWKHLSSNYLLLPATNTKTNRSRSIPINNKLRLELELWEQHVKPKSSEDFIFSGRFPNSYYKRQSFDKALRKYSPFEDISTHTFRRSVLTEMKRKGIPLDVICSISGHQDVKTLLIYLGIDSAEQFAAVNGL